MKSKVIALLVVALAIIYLVTLNYFFESYFIANFPPRSDPIRDNVAEQYDSPLSKWRKKRIGEKRANEAWQKRLKEAPEGYDPAWNVAEQYDSPLSKWRKKRIGEKRANEAWQKRLKEAPEGYDPAWKVRFPTSWPKECLNDDNDDGNSCRSDDDCCQSLVCDVFEIINEHEAIPDRQCTTWGWLLRREPLARQRQREKDAKAQREAITVKWRKKRIGEKRANEARQKWVDKLKETPEGYDPAWEVRFPTSRPKECLNDDNDERIFCDSHDDCCQSLDSDGECCQMMYCDKGLGEVESNNGQCKTWGWMLWIEPWARQRQREKDAKEKP
eukprot:CAMPEP_0183742698 /NCGR_PEP_ID=MMETSP0737-20130205/64831_1 /TAXON_ID=385413 /ORGANISM="Thalassiosira miniscula, Strain CCMP1093" /LENGTH=328 /DNA_ID=CAMNT_0025978289 /DNA_START=199 /DNA_END=1185 /DNA_ORIENTATION=+